MALFEWTNEFSVGIDYFDAQHKNLVRLINDLVATANSIPLLSKDEVSLLNEGDPEPEGNVGNLVDVRRYAQLPRLTHCDGGITSRCVFFE